MISIGQGSGLQTSLFHRLGNTNEFPVGFFPAPGTGFNVQTGYEVYENFKNFGGTATLALFVFDVGDFAVDSALVLDAAGTPKVETPVAVTPEPATLMLLGTTFASLGSIVWRRHRQRRG